MSEMHVSSDRKVFIFNFYNCNTTDGGPSGFLAQNVLGYSSVYYDVNPVFPDHQLFRDHLRKRFIKPPVHRLYYDWYIRCEKIYKSYHVSRYPIVYFHDVFSLACCIHLIPAHQIVILQSHCPELPHNELHELSHVTDGMVSWATQAEKMAFARADDLVFPNEGAVEIYSSLISHHSRIHFLATGAMPVGTLQRFPLDSDLTYLLFVGRRNYIKGFDIILEAFKSCREYRRDVRLVIVGKGTPVFEDGVIDVGFSARPHDWINSCDFVLSCNRQSYFDLLVLETLSVGTPLIISTTMGHRFFENHKSAGILTIDEPTSGNLSAVLMSDALDKKNNNKMTRNSNQKLFDQYFTAEKYRERLEQFCCEQLKHHGVLP